MVDGIVIPAAGNTVLLFGPQALSFDENDFYYIRSTILDNEHHHWILDVIAELQECLSTISRNCSKWSTEPGYRLLGDLKIWFKTGEISKTPFVLPNILLSPLVVIAQLTQYSKYLELITYQTGEGDDPYAASKHNTETLGFCTGLLSALAVSSSSNRKQFQKYGAVSIRLAMLIGMVVDAQDASSDTGESRSFATMWDSAEAGEGMTRIVRSFPEVYTSVFYDQNRATVTAPARISPELQQKLRDSGVVITELGLQGRFHWKGYHDDVETLVAFCDSNTKFQFSDISALVMPTRSNSGDFLSKDPLHREALFSILIEPSQWYQMFSSVRASSLKDQESMVISFGPERCIPPSIIRELSSQLVQMKDLDQSGSRYQRPSTDNDIAVVGMACKTAGAENLEEFWELLCEGKSQHKEVPKTRFGLETPFYDIDPKRKWYGNFMDDHDKFDHKFFKKSPREIASTDPQQRHILQIAYQAVEQSGYFRSQNPDRRVGCYVGICATDYEANIGCHAPNAFSATGNLKGFIAGKVSHYFGWTGPGLTIDSACSSSAVAVHQACQAILAGECTAALAGGTHVMTNPFWYRNLAGASFLSLTGQCKPFDAKADGYCRGEGVAAVFLKKMSTAITDGDQILGTIASTAVQQNENCTSIFVPNSPSLADLFRKVISKARLKPQQITVVEAHGTGTTVGDPAEYESIRQVLGGPNRTDDLMLSSVKGLIGHVECTSGLMSLIKTLLVIRKGAIPPQASFDTINPAIKASEADHIKIPTSLQAWNVAYRAVLINNYGASGSNASMVVTQAPHIISRTTHESSTVQENIKQPFWLSGLDDKSLRAYSTLFRQYLKRNSERAEEFSLPNISFNVSRQSNHTLDRGLLFNCRSIEDLEQKLAAYEKGDLSITSIARPASRPLIFCFGGQVSTFVGLDRQVYKHIKIFRQNLDRCNSVCLSIGAGSLLPGIFQQSSIEDPVSLQTMLFAMQYSCAKSWMACNAQPVVLIGHSFGELTALCISGVLTLEDTLKMIVDRAKIIREFWGPDKGAMMAVEADLADAERLLAEANEVCKNVAPATFACFNGPKSFTIAGSSRAIEVVETMSKKPVYSSMRTKMLNVNNAFHSSLVEPLMGSLETSAQGLMFKEPSIPIARATEYGSEQKFTAKFVPEHMRNPVYFNDAVQRLANKYPSCIWLEIGSVSTVTNMASRALGSSSLSHFQAVNLTNNGLDNLADVTLSLWKAGLRVSFWQHHESQTHLYSPLILPPYQFEKVRHWMDLKQVPQKIAEPVVQSNMQEEKLPDTLLTFVGYQDKQNLLARFRVNTMIPKYERLISEHVIAQTAPICPVTVQLDLAIEGLRNLRPDFGAAKFQPQILGVENQSPICIDSSRSVWLEALKEEDHSWSFNFSSTDSQKGSTKTVHTTGKITFHSADDVQIQREFAKYERLKGHQHCLDLLNSPGADDIIQGRNIYKLFSEIVDYGEDYRGLQKLVGRGNESAGFILKKYNPDTWLDAHLSDVVCQVGGIWVNCMTDRAPTDMYIAKGIEQWIRSPKLHQEASRPESWNVSAYHHGPLDKTFLTDVFVFSATTGELMEAILGINYIKVVKASMSRLISRLTAGDTTTSRNAGIPSKAIELATPKIEHSYRPPSQSIKPAKTPKQRKEKKRPSQPDFFSKLKEIMVELSGLESEEIKEDSELANIGIDSLMGMEMAREIEIQFNCTLPDRELVEITDMPGLVKCIQKSLGSNIVVEEGTEDEEDSDENAQQSDDPDIFTPSKSDGSNTTVGGTGILEYLAEFLGTERSDMASDVILRDLGVDSLLSTELKSDLTDKFQLEIEDHVVIEELTVEELDAKVNGSAKNTAKIAQATPKPKDIITDDSVAPQTNGNNLSVESQGLSLPPSKVLEAFGETKLLTDQRIAEYRCSDYATTVIPEQTQLCVALTIEAFEQMGCSIRSTQAGEDLTRITHLPEHGRLVHYFYQMLAKESQVIKLHDNRITRTSTPAPPRTSKEILHDLLTRFPDHADANNLTYYAGSNLARVLSGKTDGIKLIFGSEEGRTLVSGMYGDWPLNRLFYAQMEDFLARLVDKVGVHDAPLKILEMGAGTGGTTKWLLPMLARLGVPVEYTFTDLAPSFVAAARKKFKMYPFMKFRTHDIEKAPADDLLGSQHVVVASNAVHATHSLAESAGNIRKILRDDGLLMMLEMTGTLYWVDMIFGLFEGWWFFNDSRTHAVADEARWERDLQSVGYGHVDWTDGLRPENKVEKVIIALASGSRYDRLPALLKQVSPATDCALRQAVVDGYVRKKTYDFVAAPQSMDMPAPDSSSMCVLLTGATGSVGCHLIAELAQLPHVKRIICLNRRSNQDPTVRQQQALTTKGLLISKEGVSKLDVFESDATKPMLGLPETTYQDLVQNVGHIIHNAWLMSAKRPVKGFESQFHIMRNMIDFANAISASRRTGSKVTFQFVSSIAVVGHYPLWAQKANVPEERMGIESVLANGYGDAKYICEQMLDTTLHKHPSQFRTMAVRIGQIAGSKVSGYWNPMEHLSYLWKSSQALKAVPNFEGPLSWTPVDDVAGTLVDLLLVEAPYPIYHIDNPVRQPWRDIIPVLADALDIPRENAVPFEEWLRRVRDAPGLEEVDNPAAKLVDFLDENFRRMSCGGLLLETTRSREHSATLRAVGPVSDDVARKFVQAWKDMKFLS